MHDLPCHYLNLEIILVSDVSSGGGDYSPCQRFWNSDGRWGNGVKFRPCMKMTVGRFGGDLTGKMRLVTYGCAVQLFKMWCVIPVLRSLQQSPIISANDLIIQSEQALFTPLVIFSIREQTFCVSFFFFFLFGKLTWNHCSLIHLECYRVEGWSWSSPHSCKISPFSASLSWMMDLKTCFVKWNLRK